MPTVLLCAVLLAVGATNAFATTDFHIYIDWMGEDPMDTHISGWTITIDGEEHDLTYAGIVNGLSLWKCPLELVLVDSWELNRPVGNLDWVEDDFPEFPIDEGDYDLDEVNDDSIHYGP